MNKHPNRCESTVVSTPIAARALLSQCARKAKAAHSPILKYNSIAVARKYAVRGLRVAPQIGLRGLAAIMALFALSGFNPQAVAATYYWDTTSIGAWSTTTDWSTSMTGSPAGTVAPLSTDSAVFNGSAVNGAETVQLSGATSITNIAFANTGTTLIDSSTTTSEPLTISGGITINSGAGAVTIGNGTDPATIDLGASQSWTNNSSSLFTAVGGITNAANTTPYTLTLAGAGSFALQGVISNGGSTGTVAITQAGTGTTTLSGADSYTGTTTVNSGTLDITNYFTSTTSPLAMGGGTLSLLESSASTQTFGGATLNAGLSTISASSSSGSPTLTLGATTDNAGGMVDFIGVASNTAAGTSGGATGTAEAALNGSSTGAVAATATITTTTEGNTGASLHGWFNGNNSSGIAEVGLYDWAATGTSSPYTVEGGSQIASFYTILNGTIPSSGGFNYDVTGNSAAPTAAEAGTDTLRFNTNTGANITFTENINKSVAIGGILVTPNVGVHNVQFNTVTSESSGINAGDTVSIGIFQNNTSGELVFIETGGYYNLLGSGSYIQGGPGTVFLDGINGNDYTGVNYLNGGVTEIASQSGGAGGVAGQLGAATSPALNLNGGTLVQDFTGFLTGKSAVNYAVALGGNGGGLGAVTNFTLTVPGAISGAAGTGPLIIGIPATNGANGAPNNGNVVGQLPGTGTGTANTASVLANGTVTLTGANTYTGGTVIDSGTLLLSSNNEIGSTSAATNSLTINSGGTLSIGTSSQQVGGVVAFAGGTVTASGAGTLQGTSYTSTGGSVGAILAGSGVTFTNVSGVTTLSGANTYSGGTTISSGELIAGNSSGSATGTGNVALNGGTLAGSGIITGTVTVSGGTLAPGTTGTTLTLGGLTYNSGTLSFTLGASSASSSIALGSGVLTLIAAPTLSLTALSGVTGGETFTIVSSSSAITGASYFSSMSPVTIGRITLSPNVSGDNLELVSSGGPDTLVWAGGAGAPGDGATWNNTQNNMGNNWDNTTTSAYDYFYDLDNVTFNDQGSPSYSVNLTTANQPGSVTINTTGTYTFSGIGSIGGTGALTITAGTLNLATSGNAYSGGTNIMSGGTLQLGVSSALPTTGTVTVGGVLDLEGFNQSVTSLAGTGTIQGSTGTGTLTFSNTGSTSFGGTIGAVSANGVAVTVSGGGSVTLSGNNTYSGLTTVSNASTLIASANSALGNSSSSTGGLSMSGASIVDFTSSTPSIAGLSGASGNSIVLGNAASGGSSTTLTITGAGAGTSFAGVISDLSASNGVGNLTLSGGNLTLSGANTFTGTTLVSGGTLTLGTALALQDSTLSLGAGTLSFGTLTAATVGGLTGSGNLTLANTTPAAVILTVNNSTADTYSGNLSGAGGLTYAGAGGLMLAGNNSFTGALTVNASKTVILTGNNSSRPSATATTTNVTGILQLQANSGNTVSGISYALGPEATAAALNLNNGSTLQLRSDSSVTFAGGNNLGGIGSSSATFDVNQLTSAGSNDIFTFAPAGFDLYRTTINVTGGNGDTLALGQLSDEGSGATHPDVFNATTGNLSINGITEITASSAMVADLEGTSTASSVTGPITSGSGTVSVTKLGTGTWTLSGANTYTGATTVSGGKLIVSGGLSGAGTTATVNGGGTLEVDSAFTNSATIGVSGAGSTLDGAVGSVGAVNVTSSGTLAPGLSSAPTPAAGVLTANGNVSLDSTSTLSIRLGVQAEGDYDQLAIGGANTLTLDNSNLALNIGSIVEDPNGADVGDQYIIVSGGVVEGTIGQGTDVFASVTGDTLSGDTITTPAGLQFNIEYGYDATTQTVDSSGTDIALQLVSVPEPGTWASLIGGLGMLLVWQRRRSRMEGSSDLNRTAAQI